MAVHCSFITVLSLFSSNFRLNYSVRVRVEQVRKSYHFLPILKFRPRARGTSFYSFSTVLTVLSQFYRSFIAVFTATDNQPNKPPTSQTSAISLSPGPTNLSEFCETE